MVGNVLCRFISLKVARLKFFTILRNFLSFRLVAARGPLHLSLSDTFSVSSHFFSEIANDAWTTSYDFCDISLTISLLENSIIFNLTHDSH